MALTTYFWNQGQQVSLFCFCIVGPTAGCEIEDLEELPLPPSHHSPLPEPLLLCGCAVGSEKWRGLQVAKGIIQRI